MLWELVTRGFVYPRFDVPRNNVLQGANYLQGIHSLALTPAGARYFAEDGSMHPADPDFVSTAISGITDLPAEVKANLEDAQMCFQHRLLRASVVMLGLAYEIMAKEVFDLIVRQSKQQRDAKAVLEGIERAVQTVRDTRSKETQLRAVRVADEIRAARNQAAHEWKLGFDDIGNVESLLILGGRNLASFWALRGTST